MAIRYATSFMARNGLRTLRGPAQGRCMASTRAQAQLSLDHFLDLGENGDSLLADIYGPQAIGTFRVDAFDCYDHGDPRSIYVD